MTAHGRARDALRRYLEQRRELGESELTLDSLHVDEVMRLMGALGESSGTVSAEREGSVEAAAAAPAVRREPQAEHRERRVLPAGTNADWRTALREAGAAPIDSPPMTDEEERPMTPRKSAGRTSKTDPDTPSTPGNPPPALDEIPAGIEVGGEHALKSAPEIGVLRSVDAIARMVEKCTRCPLYETATHGVPGEGNPNADLVCVGEAPGANEDATGRPFVGQAGQLLTKILAAISLSREDVFICNVLKHRPPGNRNPRPEEVEACTPYLVRQLELVKPRVIIAFGTFAAQTLLETKLPLGKLRGQIHRYHGIPLIVTYHPAALLRNSAWKRPTWEDVQLARRLLDSTGSS